MTLKCLTWVIGVSGNQKWKARTLMCLEQGWKGDPKFDLHMLHLRVPIRHRNGNVR